jgi:PASTA domain
VDGLSGADARKTIGDAGFSATVVKQMDKNADPGTVLAVTPEPGSRAQLGSSVTITVARAPRWTPVDRVEGTEDARTEPLTVPAGDRLVLTTVDTSPLGLFGGAVDVGLSGDVGDVSRVDAGESVVLTGAAGGPRTIQVALDVHGSVHWALAVEEPR